MEKTEKNKHGSRINELPDALLHQVLSFLDMKQVVDTARVSTRWRYLWIYVQTLNFALSFWEGEKFNYFVENVFLLRDGSSSANKFNLRLLCSSINIDKINKWLIMASRKRVPQVSFKIYSFGRIRELTPIIFMSHVQVLEIESTPNIIQIPYSICYALHLRTLNLKSIRLPEGGPEGRVTLECHVLENLLLANCYYAHLKSFNISVPRLKLLTVENNSKDLVETVGSCKIRISTPMLATIKFKCCSFKNYVVEKCASLVSAKVEFACGTLLDDEGKASLNSLKNVTSFELSDWPHELCLELQDRLDQMPDLFCNLRCLKLMNWHQPSCIPALACLLTRSPNIEYLLLELVQGNSKTTTWGDLEKLFNFEHMFDDLKSVEIRNFSGGQVEMKLLESLLKNAMNLEELTIVVDSATNTKVRVKHCTSKIHALPRASSRLLTFVLPP